MITWQDIQQCYQRTLRELQALVPTDKWQTQPQLIQLTQHKTKYGMADIKGVVYINQAFIGSEADGLLDVTIRHELAHLCVGIDQGHNAHFKSCARLFKANFGQHLKTQTQAINEAIGFKYKLFARLENQQEILFKTVHRKHAKYLNYKPKFFSYLTIKGQKVLSFRYE
ncbi:hypothetical protein OS175_11330 [Marinicella sp. S1101]|uniref:hypothetical protein n=1 Tax=Marinicella marina TaxID=2996016 RepID=UPI002260DD59|nr:hypothetical protein [Marinicella marina]MCX7554476.1 hypothetical protein [Marinicella marina]MDJ1140627.1 hypothetical protein [Marinicella marina]